MTTTKTITNATCWTKPTTWIDRFSDAITILCAGNRPPEKMILDWFDETKDSFELQEFCIQYCPLMWSQGIVVIDAALTLADEPAEGVGHKDRNGNCQPVYGFNRITNTK